MAKSKSFFGLRRGSTKSMTFQVLNGGQITKDRVSDVKNPRTQSQMLQRMIMATAGAGYKAMRAICDHSFEGVSYGQKSYSEFMKLNVNAMVNDIKSNNHDFSYNPYGNTKLYASPFILSKGSLQNPNKIVQFDPYGNTFEVGLNKTGVDTAQISVEEFLNICGLKIGDFLTFVGIKKVIDKESWEFWWVRLRVRASSSQPVSQVDINDVFGIETDLNVEDFYWTEHGFLITCETEELDDDQIYGTTILSRKSNNRWLRSNATIIFPGSPVNNPTAADALATYPVGTNYILNGANINGGGGIAPIVEVLLYRKFVQSGSQQLNVLVTADKKLAILNGEFVRYNGQNNSYSLTNNYNGVTVQTLSGLLNGTIDAVGEKVNGTNFTMWQYTVVNGQISPAVGDIS